jgi:hypothetical protein
LAPRLCLGTLAIALMIAAAPFSDDADWPCQQRLVPKLAPAAYWSGSLDGLGDWRLDSEVAELVRELAPRRVTIEQGLTQIAIFAQAAREDHLSRLTLAFRGLLEETDRERADLIERLKQIGRRQRELLELAGRLAGELDSIPHDAAGETTAKRIDLQQRYDFTTRNFEEVQRTIRYACEAPVRLDARLGAWARALQAAVSP